jgi:hypothetical protein
MMAGKANAHVFVVTVIYGIGVARRKLRGTNYTTRKGDDRTARGGALAARLRREMLSAGVPLTRHHDLALSVTTGGDSTTK